MCLDIAMSAARAEPDILRSPRHEAERLAYYRLIARRLREAETGRGRSPR